MKFDIDEVLTNMLSAVKKSLKTDWPFAKETANNFFQSRKERLDLLTSLRLSNQLSEEFYESRILDEKKILISELHALAIISKVLAQNAANAAFDILEKALKAALSPL
ncbi:MAG: hypothetical protein JSS67_08065 [Bacteroidetes bacterium]|nr:hypothetical protein [Bacteroidota bacterium]